MNVYTYTYIIYIVIYTLYYIYVYINIWKKANHCVLAEAKVVRTPNNAPPSHGRCPVWRRIMSCLASLGRATLKKLNTLKKIWINTFDIVGSWHILIHTDTNFVITETLKHTETLDIPWQHCPILAPWLCQDRRLARPVLFFDPWMSKAAWNLRWPRPLKSQKPHKTSTQHDNMTKPH